MSTVTTLIQPAEIVNAGIVKATPLSSRFDASQIAPWIGIAEKRFLLEPKSFMCKTFYDDLLAEKNPTPSQYNPAIPPLVDAFPSNAAYETLWKEHLLTYLSLASYVVALPSISMQTGSNGLFYNNTEFSNNAGAEGMKLMQDTQMQNLNDLKACMIQFLCDNKDNYPLFCTKRLCKDDCPTDDHNGRDLGIIFY